MLHDDKQNSFAPAKELKYLFFDLNSYFASVEQQDRPELRNKPVAVVPSDTDATCAIAASYEAKAFGIKTGTKIYDAKKMCPDLICVVARHDKYVEYHHRIFEEVENHIPITKVCSVDEAACRLMRNERSPEQASAIAGRIKVGLKRNIGEYVRCSIGIAPNMFLAKTATDMQKPDGLVILHPHSFKEQMFTLKLRDLCGIGANIERRLNDAGIHSVEQFWNLPPKHARKIWGSVGGERFWYSLHGYEIPDTPTEKSVVGHSRVLDPQHRSSDAAYDIALNLTVKASARLRRYELFAKRLSLSVRTVDRIYWGGEQSFAPTHDSFLIANALETMWRQMSLHTRKANLLKVSVNLHDLYKTQEVTLDLFAAADKKGEATNTELLQAMDSLNKRYGAGSINLGSCPKTSAGFVGTKISFTRVPERTEFSD
jgi:DNA polymerase-4